MGHAMPIQIFFEHRKNGMGHGHKGSNVCTSLSPNWSAACTRDLEKWPSMLIIFLSAMADNPHKAQQWSDPTHPS
jgi:hypothetical protein